MEMLLVAPYVVLVVAMVWLLLIDISDGKEGR